MKRTRGKKYLLVLILIFFITIGYAFLTSNLKINGIANINSNTWDIHFENVVPSASNTITPTIAPVALPADKVTELNYSINLTKPGDIYEFNVDIVNAGTLDSMIELITSTIKIGNGEVQELNDSTLPSYLNYYVRYSDGINISTNHILNKGTRETITIHVEYKMDISESELVETDKPIEFTYDMEYVQATDEATSKPIANNCIFDGPLTKGIYYPNGQYVYKYKEYMQTNEELPIDGWSVKVSNPNSTEAITTPLCTSINGKPIVSTSYMFYNSQASSIDLSSFYTSNVIDMQYMFSKMPNIVSLDVGSLDTSNVTNMYCMFESNDNLEKIDNLDKLNLKKVTNMGYFLFENKKMKELKITNWDLSNIENAYGMFGQLGYNSNSLDFEVSNFKLPKVTSFDYVFDSVGYNTENLNFKVENIEVKNANEAIETFESIGSNSENADIFINNINIKNATKIQYLFQNIAYSTSNTDLTISNINIESATTSFNNFERICYSSSGIANININNINMNSFTDISSDFYYLGANAYNITINIDNLFINGANNLNDAFESVGQRGKEVYLNISNVHANNALSANNCFRYVGQSANKIIIKIKDWETPKLTSTDSMFTQVAQGAKELSEIIIDNIDLSKVTTTRFMFASNGESNYGTTKIKLLNINTPSLTDAENMFTYTGAHSSQFIIEGLNNIDFSHVTNFHDLFYHSGQNENNITDLGTINIYADNISSMFYEFKSIKVTLNIYKKPTNYSYALYNAATNHDASITVNYASEVDNIDDIIATKSDNSNIIKGQVLD